MQLMLGAAVTMAGYVVALLTVWVRERHRQTRMVNVALRLPPGSRYIEHDEGVVIEIGPPSSEPSDGQGRHERWST